MSAPEFDGTPMTRREVLIARKAFEEGADLGGWTTGYALVKVMERDYPLPTVTRPRVVAVEGVEYCVRNGVVEARPKELSGWHVCLTRAELVAIINLAAEPTETVTEEEG